MATEPCDGCGRAVPIAGGIANLWSFRSDSTDGLALELADGTDCFLCFDCIERLPENPRAEDVAALAPARNADAEDSPPESTRDAGNGAGDRA